MTPPLTELTQLTEPLYGRVLSVASVLSVTPPMSESEYSTMTFTPEPARPANADDTTAQQAASRSGRVLAYWRWGKISELLEAAGQLVMFDRPNTSEPPQPAEPEP